MKEKNCGIYCIENLINGKKYIGWTTDAKDRFYKHKWALRKGKHINICLQNTWNKYGEENFKFWIIEEYPKDEELLRLMEIYFIAYYNSFVKDGGGYNLSRGGEGQLGYIATEETRKKLSEGMMGENNPNYGKFGEDNPHYGFRHSNESIIKMKKNHSDNSGENHYFYGKHHSDEVKEKISKGRTGKHHSEETLEKMRKSHIKK